jgi:hypothetical protein
MKNESSKKGFSEESEDSRFETISNPIHLDLHGFTV